MKKKLEQIKHGWIIPAFFSVYLVWFFLLEKKQTSNITLIHASLDDVIPFVEYFIVPYVLWFFYIGAAFVYMLFDEKKDFYQMCGFLFSGMIIALFVCTVFPNGLNLRPVSFERDNVFTKAVKFLYTIDTSTNVCPSIHVFNSIGVHIALSHNERFRKHKFLNAASFILCISIILSTVFLKQHSVIDVVCASVMALILYPIVYWVDYEAIRQRRRRRLEEREYSN